MSKTNRHKCPVCGKRQYHYGWTNQYLGVPSQKRICTYCNFGALLIEGERTEKKQVQDYLKRMVEYHKVITEGLKKHNLLNGGKDVNKKD